MSEPVTNVEIEDVLSSIRRLISEDGRDASAEPAQTAQPDATPVQDWDAEAEAITRAMAEPDTVPEADPEPTPAPELSERLVLTPALRVLSDPPKEATPEPVAQEPAAQEPVEPASEETPPAEQNLSADATALRAVLSSLDVVPEPEPESEPSDHAATLARSETAPSESAPADTEQSNTAQAEPAPAVLESEAPEIAPVETQAEARPEPEVQEAEVIVEAAPEQSAPDPIIEADVPDTPDAADAPDDTDSPGEKAELTQRIAQLEKLMNRGGGEFEPEQGNAPIAEHSEAEVTPLARPAPEADAAPAPAEPSIDLDEDALRDLVSEIVRQELQGALGEKITRNVRKLVRREIHRALASQDID